MATQYQTGTKRQKIREIRNESVDYFQGIDKIEYNNMASTTEGMSYRYYNSSERVHGRTMEDWLKFSVSFTAFKNNGADQFGRQCFNRSWDDGSNSIDNYKRCIRALFDFCVKLGVKYWSAFDTDLVPLSDSWDENKNNCDEIIEYVQENMQRTNVKPLWIAADLHSHPRYVSGAITSNDATTFLTAAAQTKRALEIAQKLNAECFLFWPHREGYDSVFKSDVSREVKLYAKILKMASEYKDRLPYRGQFLIMPCYNVEREFEKGTNKYIFDANSCMYFLRHFNLERYFKVCLSPGHGLSMAHLYNMLGGTILFNRTLLDRDIIAAMKSLIDQGNSFSAGVNLNLLTRRDSLEIRDMLYLYIRYIDAAAKALKVASSIISEQIFTKHIQQRYISYHNGYGARVVGGDISLEDCEEYAKKSPCHDAVSSRSEYWDIIIQRYIENCDRI